jgi:molybdenum cofactor cytidylyltransferase
MVLALVDAPLFSAATVRALVRRFHETGVPVVRAVRGSEHGHPVLIGRQLFGAIRQADPSAGAKPIVRAHASAAGDVTIDDPGAFVDVDTPEDYARLIELRGA